MYRSPVMSNRAHRRGHERAQCTARRGYDAINLEEGWSSFSGVLGNAKDVGIGLHSLVVTRQWRSDFGLVTEQPLVEPETTERLRRAPSTTKRVAIGPVPVCDTEAVEPVRG